MLRIEVLTLFPPMLEGFISSSIVRIAREKGLVDISLVDFRRYAKNRWGKVDDRPYGGGPGMVLQCEPIFLALEGLLDCTVGPGGLSPVAAPGLRALLLTPQGRRLDQAMLGELAEAERLILVCGHYEGFDERIRAGLGLEELSIGDYVLSGGEPAAAVVIDGVVRLLAGALGDPEATLEESCAGLGLEYPHFYHPLVLLTIILSLLRLR